MLPLLCVIHVVNQDIYREIIEVRRVRLEASMAEDGDKRHRVEVAQGEVDEVRLRLCPDRLQQTNRH